MQPPVDSSDAPKPEEASQPEGQQKPEEKEEYVVGPDGIRRDRKGVPIVMDHEDVLHLVDKATMEKPFVRHPGPYA